MRGDEMPRLQTRSPALRTPGFRNLQGARQGSQEGRGGLLCRADLTSKLTLDLAAQHRHYPLAGQIRHRVAQRRNLHPGPCGWIRLGTLLDRIRFFHRAGWFDLAQ
jgi:hypothetical protein